MAKIDVTQIEGFNEMSDADKVKALTSYNLPDPDYSGYVKKDVFDKTSSEVAEWKRKFRAAASEDEQKKAEQAEQMKSMQDELENLRKEKTVSGYKAKFIAQGYDEALAEKTATALADGDMKTVFDNNQKFLSDLTKKMEKDQMRGDGRKPESGGTGGAIDFSKEIKEAREHGDMSRVAYLTRKQQEFIMTGGKK